MSRTLIVLHYPTLDGKPPENKIARILSCYGLSDVCSITTKYAFFSVAFCTFLPFCPPQHSLNPAHFYQPSLTHNPPTWPRGNGGFMPSCIFAPQLLMFKALVLFESILCPRGIANQEPLTRSPSEETDASIQEVLMMTKTSW